MTKNDHDHDEDAVLDLSDLVKNDKFGSNNRIWVGDVTDAAAKTFAEKVQSITEKDQTAPVVVMIDSDGGSVQALMTMISVMDSVPNPFITVALGRAISAGAALLAHGDVRFASPYSRIMIHESSWVAFGHIEDGRTTMAEWEVVNDQLMRVLGNDMGKSKAAMKALFTEKRDHYMSADEALKKGLIDSIGVPAIKAVQAPVVTNMTYEISLLKDSQKPSILRQKGQAPKKKSKKAKKKS